MLVAENVENHNLQQPNLLVQNSVVGDKQGSGASLQLSDRALTGITMAVSHRDSGEARGS